MFYGAIAVIVIRLIGNVAVFAGGMLAGGMSSSAVMGITGIFGILYLLANGIVSLALLVLAVMVAIQASGRGRTGAIIVAATLIVAVIAYWIINIPYQVVISGATDTGTIGTASIVFLVVEIVRALIVFAALIIGAMMARRWAKDNA